VYPCMTGPFAPLGATGDWNGDSRVDATDLTAFMTCWLSTPTDSTCLTKFDFDESGLIDLEDYGVMLSLVYPTTATCLTPAESSSLNWFFFTGQPGQMVSANDLVYEYRARSYDPGNARFYGRDRLRQYLDGMNLLQYVRGLPTRYLDPTGAGPEDEPGPPAPEPGERGRPPIPEPGDGTLPPTGSQPSDGPRPEMPPEGSRPNNLDPATHIGAMLSGHATACGIYIVRETNINGTGHTSIVWSDDALGYTSGPNAKSDQGDIDRINKRKIRLSIYSVKFSGSYYERYAYQAGPKKGQCCDQDCTAIVECLRSQIRQPHGFNRPPSIGEAPNCNTFAAQALGRCCLDRDKLVVDGYRDHWTLKGDSERENLDGWSGFGSGRRVCGLVR